ncbi:serine hydrolase [Rhodoblastus acidophilus]|uniref:Serine hydrolase n=1 Tax=Candidatus Rhodoblastus alkanivorans TaxID=2954117 RepID=A0ABS9Z1N3_9HYPH|nr:serine hydrolase [Candidatus Rhodoblastus alkanivorans]MCI4678115.1 serine hydrolase [Candidatus Rhodoblastus alkanivorans]MCI4681544.1 serine hydrolase [Candidatus Rhodoblastus alkanivorans]MDI4642592.1 serine hydrolase [Rhodoblastus acidophilus]
MFSNSHRFRLTIGLCAAALFLLDGGSIASARQGHRHAKGHAHVASAPVHYTPPPFISIDVATGRVIESRDATHRWFPASVTKLMTVYVALQAVQQGRLSLDTPLIVSARAASMRPSKMAFAPGSLVTLDNALKMLMVKSANDVAVTVAEGVSGSVEAFADEMNQTAAKLGMRDSHFANPNGLPDPNHYTSPRDMAILGRALLVNFPQYAGLFDIGAMKLGDRVIPNHNGLIGRYSGADGMKTGFTCAAGFNLVASATRGGRKVIVVILGDLTARIRTGHAADLLDRAFASNQLGEPAADLPSVGGGPPDMHAEICGGRSPKAVLEAESEDFNSPIQTAPGATPPVPGAGAMIAALPRPVFDPTPVYVGEAPGYQGPIAGPRPANTPIGAIAYTTPAPEHAAAPTPIQPDPKALSMHRGAKVKHAAKHAGAGKKKAEARKPTTTKAQAKKTETKKAAGSHPHAKSETHTKAKKQNKDAHSSAAADKQAKKN